METTAVIYIWLFNVWQLLIRQKLKFSESEIKTKIPFLWAHSNFFHVWEKRHCFYSTCLWVFQCFKGRDCSQCSYLKMVLTLLVLSCGTIRLNEKKSTFKGSCAFLKSHLLYDLDNSNWSVYLRIILFHLMYFLFH